MHAHLTALRDRLRTCSNCAAILALAAGILVVDAAVELPETGLLLGVAVLVPLYEHLQSRRAGSNDGSCCDHC